ncbi:MAG: hypothetical protein ACLFVL_06825 [Candidatus Aenigmatarchaeota archaeon]
MGSEGCIPWEKVEESIQKKIDKIRVQEEDIGDPVLMSFLQVHEEILHDVREDLREHVISDDDQD